MLTLVSPDASPSVNDVCRVMAHTDDIWIRISLCADSISGRGPVAPLWSVDARLPGRDGTPRNVVVGSYKDRTGLVDLWRLTPCAVCISHGHARTHYADCDGDVQFVACLGGRSAPVGADRSDELVLR